MKGETVAKLKVAINGFGRIGRNFLRCWHGRKDSPLDVVVVNDSGGVKNVSSPKSCLFFPFTCKKCAHYVAVAGFTINSSRSVVKDTCNIMLMQASHLLKYDSMLGTFKADVKVVDNETISVDGKPIKVVSNRDPLKLPWAELGIDIVIEVKLIAPNSDKRRVNSIFDPSIIDRF